MHTYPDFPGELISQIILATEANGMNSTKAAQRAVEAYMAAHEHFSDALDKAAAQRQSNAMQGASDALANAKKILSETLTATADAQQALELAQANTQHRPRHSELQ